MTAEMVFLAVMVVVIQLLSVAAKATTTMHIGISLLHATCLSLTQFWDQVLTFLTRVAAAVAICGLSQFLLQ